MSDYHAIERTSPKGQKFFGTCFKCGRTNLPMSAVAEPCDNIAGISGDDALIMAIKGQEKSNGSAS